MLELQPKMDTAKVIGMRKMIRETIAIFVSFTIAYVWRTGADNLWFWYTMAIAMAVAFAINIVLFSCKLYLAYVKK
jgi:hypothetical protein